MVGTKPTLAARSNDRLMHRTEATVRCKASPPRRAADTAALMVFLDYTYFCCKKNGQRRHFVKPHNKATVFGRPTRFWPVFVLGLFASEGTLRTDTCSRATAGDGDVSPAQG